MVYVHARSIVKLSDEKQYGQECAMYERDTEFKNEYDDSIDPRDIKAGQNIKACVLHNYDNI